MLLYFPQKRLELGRIEKQMTKKRKGKKWQKSVISSERRSRWEIQDARSVKTTWGEGLFKTRKARAVTSP